ncbi:MAG TPA: class I SAM-dependent methyltransferase [Candidatus Dormibacteraeota bacterium]|jgi:SAM-dependent methyltransferase|nr:class I SAM-dependent methyltransferase [Candidatus Dormibacteraeota bacterium]
MRVLDLGCGDGLTPQKLGLPLGWQIIGVDVKAEAVSKARLSFPQRAFICSVAEALPFGPASFDRVIANVALPYMNVAKALSEIYRVLRPGGMLLASLHPWSFTLAELREALPRPKPGLYRLLVFANGIAFHVVGCNFGEAFQTERGMRIALRRANFGSVSFRRDAKRWFVEASKPLETPARRAA